MRGKGRTRGSVRGLLVRKGQCLNMEDMEGREKATKVIRGRGQVRTVHPASSG